MGVEGDTAVFIIGHDHPGQSGGGGGVFIQGQVTTAHVQLGQFGGQNIGQGGQIKGGNQLGPNLIQPPRLGGRFVALRVLYPFGNLAGRDQRASVGLPIYRFGVTVSSLCVRCDAGGHGRQRPSGRIDVGSRGGVLGVARVQVASRADASRENGLAAARRHVRGRGGEAHHGEVT